MLQQHQPDNLRTACSRPALSRAFRRGSHVAGDASTSKEVARPGRRLIHPGRQGVSPSAMQLHVLDAATRLSAADTPLDAVRCFVTALHALTDGAAITLHHRTNDEWKLIAASGTDGTVQIDETLLPDWQSGAETAASDAAGAKHQLAATNCKATHEQLTQVMASQEPMTTDDAVYEPVKLSGSPAVIVIATSNLQQHREHVAACRAIVQQAENAYNKTLQTINLQRSLATAENNIDELQTKLEAAELSAKKCTEEAKAARLAAEQANATQSKFLATISHELRTPMNGLIGMSDLLLDSQVTSEQREALLIIRNCAEALLLLVNDVLDMSQVETGEFELHNQCFNLRDMIESALDVVADAACNKHLDFAAEIVLTSPIICYGDPRRCQQILTNLLSNAVKFTSAGHLGLEVQSHLLDDASELKPPSQRYLYKHQEVDADVDLSTLDMTDDWPSWELRFVITDSGIGIDDQYKHLLFKRFSQLPAPLDPMRRGSGLGLSICQQIAQRMHGTVTAQSDGVGKGSVFTLTLQLPGRADIGVPRDIAQAISVEEMIQNHNGEEQTDQSLISAMTRAYTPTVTLTQGNDEDRNKLIERVTAPELLSSGVLIYHPKMQVAEKIRRTCELWGSFGRSSDNLQAVAHLVAYSAFLTTLQTYDVNKSQPSERASNDMLLQVINNVNKSKRCQQQLSPAHCLSVISLVSRPFESVIMVQLADDKGPLQAAKLIKEVFKAVSDQTRYVLQSNGTIDHNAASVPGIGILISATLAYRQVAAVEDGDVSYYLAQPIRPQQLFDSLRKICERRQSRSQLSKHRRLATDAAVTGQNAEADADSSTSSQQMPATSSRSPNGGAKLPMPALSRVSSPDMNSSLSLSSKALSPTARPEPAPSSTSTDERSLRILVVEDNQLNMKVLQRVLKNLNHADVAYAYDGLQAIKAVTGVELHPSDLESAEKQPAQFCSNAKPTNTFDFILMDWQMPHCDGLQATRIIRRFGATNPALNITDARPMIVALTANAMIGDRETCLQSGCNAYLAKPVRRQELAKLLDAAKQATDTDAEQQHD